MVNRATVWWQGGEGCPQALEAPGRASVGAVACCYLLTALLMSDASEMNHSHLS